MPLEFDDFQPRNKCGAVLIGIASLVERCAINALGNRRGRAFPTWSDVLDQIKRESEPFKSNGRKRPLSDFLEADKKKRIGLTGRNLGDSLRRFEDAIRICLSRYLASDAPISLASSDRLIRQNDTVEFIKLAKETLENLCNPGEIGKLMESVSPVTFEGEIVSALVNSLFPSKGTPRHPDFLPLSLLDPFLIKSEFFSAQDEIAGDDSACAYARGSFDLYSVLREARGWGPEVLSETNMVVRDLLWLRRSTDVMQYDAEDFLSGKEFLGVYVSAIDRTTFYVHQIDIHGQEVTLVAKEEGGGPTDQRITLMYPVHTMTHPLQLRSGILTGVIGPLRSLAAFKCALVRPNWEHTRQVATLAAQLSPSTIKRFYQICADASMVGVFYSEDLRRINRDLAKIRRESFRHLTASDTIPRGLGDYMADKVRDAFQGEILRFFKQFRSDMEKPGANWDYLSERLSRILVDDISTMVTREKDIIEPAQVVNYNRRNISEMEEDLSQLYKAKILDLLDLSEISEYVPQVPNPSMLANGPARNINRAKANRLSASVKVPTMLKGFHDAN